MKGALKTARDMKQVVSYEPLLESEDYDLGIVGRRANGQNMRMFVSGSTKFIRDGKKSKVSEFHDGDPVTVDAERDVRMNLVALRVEVVQPKPPQPTPLQPTPPDGAEKPGTEKPN